MTRRWRRLDEPGLEVLDFQPVTDGHEAVSTIVNAGPTPFTLTCRWRLDADWRSVSLTLTLVHPERRTLEITRAGPAAWIVNAAPRPDLDGCEEVDVSVTPFCNALAIRRLAGRAGELTALYVAVPDLTFTPSRQRYEPLGPGRWRYIDLGVARGFEADLALDADGLVETYEGLFEAV